jgi:DNA polymerase-1
MSAHLVLIDGSGFIYRAFHAIAPLSRKRDGLPVNAIYGFALMLWRMSVEAKIRPTVTHLAVVLDCGGRTWRHELYGAYKQQRKAPPDALIPQLPYIREVIEAFDAPAIEYEGVEADDIIATLAADFLHWESYEGTPAQVTIVTSDKDMMALVRDGSVQVYDQMRDKWYREQQVEEKYGVPPKQITELLALMGDTSDNIPGVPKVGIKTAGNLLQKHGCIEEILRAVEGPPGLRANLDQYGADALLSRKLAQLNAHVPLAERPGDLVLKPLDSAKLCAFFDRMEFRSLKDAVVSYTRQGTP